jgi:hypothetical protein
MSIIKYILGEIKNLWRLFTLIFDTAEPKLEYSSMSKVSEETTKILTDFNTLPKRREITLTPKPTYRLFIGLHTENVPLYYPWKYLPDQNISVYRKIIY